MKTALIEDQRERTIRTAKTIKFFVVGVRACGERAPERSREKRLSSLQFQERWGPGVRLFTLRF